MKTMLKKIVAVAALLAAGSSHAVEHELWQYVSGGGSLTFSQEALDALDAAGASIYTNPGNPAQYDNVNTVAMTFTGGTGEGNQLATIESIGSQVFIQRSVLKKGVVTLDNLITLSDFKIDLATSTISAGILGTNLLTGVSTNYGFGALFRGAATVGGTITEGAITDGWVAGTASGSLTGPLTIDETTANSFALILGLPTTGSVADLVKNADWGTSQASGVVKAKVISAVPESSTFMLMGVGLVGLAMMRRRQAA